MNETYGKPFVQNGLLDYGAEYKENNLNSFEKYYRSFNKKILLQEAKSCK